jgi:4'-phosphopantetheinyl transferase EntD
LSPFTVAFHHATPHGALTAVHLVDSPDPAPEGVLARLPPQEAELARSLRGYRQGQFVAGRIALRRACEQLGVQPPPLLATDRGAPLLPPGLAGSVSHKRTLAIGMVAASHGGTLGCDLEDYAPPRLGIASHILTAGELDEVTALPEANRWTAVLLRFSIKEAIYKALDPYVRRYVGFHEAIVTPDLQRSARVELRLAHGEGPFEVEARYDWLVGRLVTSVRIRPAVA